MIDIARDAHLPKMNDIGAGYAPAMCIKLADCGIDKNILIELTLRTAHILPQFTTEQMAGRIHLSHVLTAELLEQLRKDMLLEVHGQEGPFSFRYSITAKGRERADRSMAICGYIGPAPVSLEAYRAMLEWQTEQNPSPTPEEVKTALADLVLSNEAVMVAGVAISSGRSLFVSGPPGNGKTTLGHLLNRTCGTDMWIPYAIAIDQVNIIRLFDAHCHAVIAHDSTQPVDNRWVKIRRPFIVAGGEMTLASLDLAYMPSLKYYEAPLHMKANGGTFLIDDFGRQHVAPEDLLNRWIIPLEHRVDFLTLHSGQKIEVPFLPMLIIATNLDPKDVTDPAFLRRIGYRIEIKPPTPQAYSEIFTRYAQSCGADADPQLIARLLEKYKATGRELRACEPRDLILRVSDICKYQGRPLELNDELLALAWDSYFGNSIAA